MEYEISIGRLRRDRGISVARPTALGNPYKIGIDGDRAEVIRKYRVWLLREMSHDPRVREAIERITSAARQADITLLCFCAPQACHAEVIAEFVRDRIAKAPSFVGFNVPSPKRRTEPRVPLASHFGG